jgi:type VI protein secretion system component Hcp
VEASKADILMKFVDKKRDSVWAESTLDVLKSDPFLQDFEPITEYSDYSNFFEVKSFNYTMKLAPHDDNVGRMSHPRAPSTAAHEAADEFSRWRSATGDAYKKIRFPIEFDNFSFTRTIDGASPLFFNACCNQDSFHSATLVKRVATGGIGGIERVAMGYLRFDFLDVMLTNLDWDDGDLVTESCTFICKAMRIRYRQQRADGSFRDAPAWDPLSFRPSGGFAGAMGGGVEAVWDQKKDGQANGGGGV